MIAAVHAALSLLTMQGLSALSWGPVQFRLSEAFVVVALFTPAAIPGLALGTALANLTNLPLLGPLALLDVVFGSLATAVAAAVTWRLRSRKLLALAAPVIANALIVPAYLPLLLKGLGLYRIPVVGTDVEGRWVWMYAFGVVAIAVGQAVVVYGLGWPLAGALERLRLTEVLDRR
jgi:uncharacterized membrane protein